MVHQHHDLASFLISWQCLYYSFASETGRKLGLVFWEACSTTAPLFITFTASLLSWTLSDSHHRSKTSPSPGSQIVLYTWTPWTNDRIWMVPVAELRLNESPGPWFTSNSWSQSYVDPSNLLRLDVTVHVQQVLCSRQRNGYSCWRSIIYHSWSWCSGNA